MSLCPVCREPMVQVEEAGVCAYACGKCRGTWISCTALERRTRLETAGQSETTFAPLTELAETVSQSDSKNALACPHCRGGMIKVRFHQKIPVTIDRCDAYRHIWLDAAEQGLLLTLYRELVAGQGTPLPAQQERLDRMQRSQTTYTSSSNAGSDKLDTALTIGATVLEVVFEMLTTPSHHGRRW